MASRTMRASAQPQDAPFRQTALVTVPPRGVRQAQAAAVAGQPVSARWAGKELSARCQARTASVEAVTTAFLTSGIGMTRNKNAFASILLPCSILSSKIEEVLLILQSSS